MKKTIRYVLFEDEFFTAVNIKSMIAQFRPNYCLVGEGESVDMAADVLDKCSIDLVISSVELSNGCCVDAFIQSHCRKPIILIAEEKAKSNIDRLNVIDYILKPISAESIQKSIIKFEKSMQ